MALRFPGFREGRVANKSSQPQPWHIDGLQGLKAGKGLFDFDVLVGVLLSDIDTEMSGELCYFRGSHFVLTEFLRDGGLEKLRSGGGLRKWVDAEQAFPLGVARCLGKAGDVFLAHRCTAHFISPNSSPNIRYAVYFRVKGPHPMGESELDVREFMLHPFHHWPSMRGLVDLHEDDGN